MPKIVIAYFGYLIPMFYAFYARQNRIYSGGAVDYSDGTGYSFFMFSEMSYFMLFIVSGSVFMMLAFLLKLK